MKTTNLHYCNRLLASDIPVFRRLLQSTGMFFDFEIDVAIEIMELFIKDGEKSGYYFYVAELNGQPVGYINFGPTPCTQYSWDVYWIAVEKQFQGTGIGGNLLKMAEKNIEKNNGQNIWIETSSRPDYLPTHRFYEKKGYAKMCELPDFYAPGDHKIIYLKKGYMNQ